MACGGGARERILASNAGRVYGCPIRPPRRRWRARRGRGLFWPVLAPVCIPPWRAPAMPSSSRIPFLYPDAECGRAYEPYYQLYLRQYPRCGDLPCPGRHEEPGMSGAKRILPLLAVLCFALFLLYGVYFNAFGANAESMMAFFRHHRKPPGLRDDHSVPGRHRDDGAAGPVR